MANIDHHFLMALMDTVPDRIYFKDRDCRFLSVNRAMREFLRITDDAQIIGLTDLDLYLPEHAHEAFADDQRVIATGQAIVNKEEREALPDGRVTWVSTTKVPMRDENGNIFGVCGISRDVTEDHARSEEVKAYTHALAEKQRQMEEELLLARQVQQALLPQSFPCIPPYTDEDESALRFFYRYLPESLVGGDFFTVTTVSPTKAAVLVCDVMGHGVPAALVTAVQKVLVEELQPHADDPAAFLGELNKQLHRFFAPLARTMFVTALYVVVDTVTGSVRFANAGHPPPLVISHDDGKVRPIGANARPSPFALGVMLDSTYSTQEDVVHAGDLLFVYTDGLCDLGPGHEWMPDTPEFLDLIEHAAKLEGEAFLNEVLNQARKVSGQQVFNDDVCLLGIEVRRLLAPAPQGVAEEASFTD